MARVLKNQKKYNLKFKLAILNLENKFSFIVFINFYLK